MPCSAVQCRVCSAVNAVQCSHNREFAASPWFARSLTPGWITAADSLQCSAVHCTAVHCSMARSSSRPRVADCCHVYWLVTMQHPLHVQCSMVSAVPQHGQCSARAWSVQCQSMVSAVPQHGQCSIVSSVPQFRQPVRPVSDCKHNL